MNPLLLVDSYKVHHTRMYPDGMTKLYSNMTPRKSRIKGIDKVVVFGLQHFIQTYLIKAFNEEFFGKSIDGILQEYKETNDIELSHVITLHKLQYLPIHIKALPEGSRCPIGVPMLTITNTHKDFGWLVNYLETLISCSLWQTVTSATLSYQYRKLFEKYALETTGSIDGVQWQGHDFSMRGLSSVESAILSGMGHLLSFTGTDTIPAIYQLKHSYDATGLIGASVPATEHSVMCMGQKESEIETFRRLLNLYPTGILSVVSDTWDLWKVCTEYLPELKEAILARDGKLVIRPDSGDPVTILAGWEIIDFSKKAKSLESAQDYMQEAVLERVRKETDHGECGEGSPSDTFKYNDKYYKITLSIEWNRYDKQYYFIDGSRIDKFEEIQPTPAVLGVIELLWDVFGGTVNEKGYKVLDPHIGAIYGDSITLDRAEQICERLKAKGFASTNWVAGIGSYTYQYNTRDTFGFAMKATYGEVLEQVSAEQIGPNEFAEAESIPVGREIFKDPITDDGTKRSAKGLLRVEEVKTADSYGKLRHSTFVLKDQCTEEEEKGGALETVFLDSQLIQRTNLDQIRSKLSNQ